MDYEGLPMKLLERYRDQVYGVINGLDRIRFRGTLRWLATASGLARFMGSSRILLKDFSKWVDGLTAQIRSSCESRAREQGREVRYLSRGSVDKEKLARQIAADQGITEGPICWFSVVEPCMAPMVKGNKASKQLEVVMAQRKCVWLYHYFDDPELGFGHVRIQSWVPFNVFICLNGHHWLERQLRKAGIGYVKEDNGFPWIEDIEAAQMLMNEQLQTAWSGLLNRMTVRCCPALRRVLGTLRPEYYWSAEETEWATDILFRSTPALDALYPTLLYHAMRISDSPSVMRYLGKRTVGGRAPDEIISDYRRRYEGIRIKHWVNHNSVKVYNKGGSILRIETTINHTRDFKVFRHPEDDSHRPASWQKMRKGVSDLHRRCQVSQQCNERYADALATVEVQEKLRELADPACNRVVKEGRRYRGLNPWRMEDHRLLQFIAKGEWALNGFRNKDLRGFLNPGSKTAGRSCQKSLSGKATRLIRILRAHGLIRKVRQANRYTVTEKGRKFSCAVLTASDLAIKELTERAA
jgi:hypothetical protein